ncbi:MAG: AAA+ family ATPase [Rhodospirillales bacterium]|nr:AAA+ family ATPase [Rhodospirillales bacterium]
MKHMLRRIALCLPLCLPVAPVLAQQEPNGDLEEGMSLLEQGAQMLLRGMMSEMEPALDDMARALDEAKPMLDDLLALMGEVQNYHAPEMLPNGDIIIRRKLPGEIDPAPEIEL